MEHEAVAEAVWAIMQELRALRQRRRVTQRKVAARMDTNQGQIAALEIKRRDPRLSTLIKYADALNCELIVMAVPRK